MNCYFLTERSVQLIVVISGLLLNPDNGLPKLVQVYILPPAASSSVCQPVPIVLQTLPVDSSELPPSFAAAVWDHQKLETLPELLDRLNLESTDSLRKYTKKILHEILDGCKVSIQVMISMQKVICVLFLVDVTFSAL